MTGFNEAKRVYTLGHSTCSREEFLSILEFYSIEAILDVRSFPGSRRSPWFNGNTLKEYLESHNKSYFTMGLLGGYKKPKPNSQNSGLINPHFRGYADYMQTPNFEQGLNNASAIFCSATVALLCAELLPWKCHRYLIADALVVRGVEVLHILDKKHVLPHTLNPLAVADGQSLRYP